MGDSEVESVGGFACGVDGLGLVELDESSGFCGMERTLGRDGL